MPPKKKPSSTGKLVSKCPLYPIEPFHAHELCPDCNLCINHCQRHAGEQECEKCGVWTTPYRTCTGCNLCCVCCTCTTRVQRMHWKLDIIEVREDATPEQATRGIIGYTYRYQQGVLTDMDISFQLKNKAGVVKTFTERDIVIDKGWNEYTDSLIDQLLEEGYSVVVYGGSKGAKNAGGKDYVTDENGEKVPCVLSDCDGMVWLKQAESANGKKYRSLECDKYDFQQDAKNAAGHTKAFTQKWEDDTEFTLRIPGVDKRGRANKVEILLPRKWGAAQHTAYTEDEEEDSVTPASKDKIPF